MATARTVTVYVGDITEAKEYYCEELGFDFVAQYDDRILQLRNKGVLFLIERIADHLSKPSATICTRTNGLTKEVARLRGNGTTFIHKTPRPFPEEIYTPCGRPDPDFHKPSMN
jgi:catechol 2,3-dioxygenase-like lactoylglutathione lyase family enzyme